MKELLPLFSRPSHYLGTEINSIHKDLSTTGVHVALAFPDLYEVGMSYLGQKILYDVINQRPEYYAERVFAPTQDVFDVLREHQTALATLESDTPLHKLDAVLFSLTHELCYTNVLYMLDAAHIPLHADQRGPEHPLIIAGGGCTCNAEPVAPFFDLMVLGDGEEIVLEILALIATGHEQGWERSALIQALAVLPGVYVPCAGTERAAALAQVEKRLVRDMNQTAFPTRQIVPFGKPVHDRFSVEIARGCTRGCRFCQAGMIYRPVRERSVETLGELISQGLAATGSEELSFLSLSTGDFSSLEALFLSSYHKCLQEQVSISLPSLRVGSVSAELMALMGRIRRTGLTLAPEAGTQRLRDVINKGVTEDELLAHTTQAFELGWQQVKLYFMIGLPTETTADLDGILDLCLKVAQSAGPKARRLQITAAVSPFVPKPHTPFQWEEQLSMEETEERIAYLRSLFRPYKKLKLKWHHSHMSFLEGVFSRGDRRLAKVVEDAYQRGAVFTSWSDHLDLEPWQAAFAEAGITASDYLLARDLDQPLPWDHLQCGVSREFLLTERARALREAQTPDCRYAACRSCGVCTLDGRTSLLTEQARAGEIVPVVNLARRDQEQSSAPEPVQRTEDVHHKAQRFRLWYSKVGPATYLSQLELQRIFERAFRRVGLPLSFSSGFHPAPLVSFARALPVGVGSVCEWMDFFVRERIDPDAILARLSEEFPHGMRAVEVQELPCQRKAPVSVGETFVLSFAHARHEERFAHAVRDFMRAETWIVPKLTKKGEPGELDIRSMVTEVRSGSQGFELEFDWREGYVSPVFLLQGIDTEFSLVHARITKIGQYFDNGAKMLSPLTSTPT
ncbi:MAG: TIGR03960 family B12-binding radical SAM protein [Desulfovibrionales bacterium]|nr:TIGR03960 family B12-binding radical SAM protein [Desulfovibrionales bacterium]